MNKWLLDAALDIDASHGINDIKCILAEVRAQLDFEMFLYAVKLPKTFTRPMNFIISEYPKEWVERYAKQAYANVDPVVKHCLSSHTPYRWKNFIKYTDKATRDFMKEACDFGLCSGISVGMKGFDGENGLLCIASGQEKELTKKDFYNIALSLNALLPYIHEKVRKILQNDEFCEVKETLSEREEECLLWIAEGKTAKEVAQILSISEATVVFHLKNTINKLGVVNRNQAVAKAVLLGIISPKYPQSSIATYHF